MVLVVEKVGDFMSLVSKYANRTYIVYQLENSDGKVEVRVVAGRIALEACLDANSQEYKKLMEWLQKNSAIKIKYAIPEELFFTR